jgi:nickel-type superoxide dismutase maturation protease
MIRDATLFDRLLIMLRRRSEILIEGDSMLPVLAGGDRVVVDPSASLSAEDIVVAYHPYKKNVSIVKRIAEVRADGRLVLLGENLSESTDSRHFGSVGAKEIYGKVVARIRRGE